MKFFYESYIAAVVAMVKVHEKFQMTFSCVIRQLISIKFLINQNLYQKVEEMVMIQNPRWSP